MIRKQALELADVTSKYSWLKGFDPLHAIHGGGVRYPKVLADMFPGNEKLAYRLWVTGAAALLGAGISGLAKSVTNTKELAAIRKYTEPDYDLKTQLSTTFNTGMMPKQLAQRRRKQDKSPKDTQSNDQEKAASYTIKHPSALGAETYMDVALPSAAFLAAAAMTYKYLDDKNDRARNAALDASIARKNDTLKRLMHTRARLAKGTAAPEEVQAAVTSVPNADVITKTGGLMRKLAWDPNGAVRKGNVAFRLLLAGLTATSAVGAYKYFHASDPEQIKYKAYKKALETYAKQKTQHTPLTVLPADASDYFKSIAEAAEMSTQPSGKPSRVSETPRPMSQESMPQSSGDVESGLSVSEIRDTPELGPTNKPISITL